ncbi:MAG: hypothetical protein ABI325_02690 [Ginsengibacter sp.]
MEDKLHLTFTLSHKTDSFPGRSHKYLKIFSSNPLTILLFILQPFFTKPASSNAKNTAPLISENRKYIYGNVVYRRELLTDFYISGFNRRLA